MFGDESADEALARFAGGVDAAVDSTVPGSVLIVAHGTVISLFVAARAGLDAWSLWQRLGLPSFVTLTLPTFAIEQEVATIEAAQPQPQESTG